MTKSTFKIFLRTDNINIDGTNTLYLLFTSKRKLKKISLDIQVLKKNWNIKRFEVKKSDVEHIRKNKYIRKHSEIAQNIIDDFFFSEKYLSTDEFYRLFTNGTYGNNSFYDFIINEMKTLIIAEGTRDDYFKQIKKLKTFRKELYFNDINLKFLNDYKHFLKEVRKNGDNTIKTQ